MAALDDNMKKWRAGMPNATLEPLDLAGVDATKPAAASLSRYA